MTSDEIEALMQQIAAEAQAICERFIATTPTIAPMCACGEARVSQMVVHMSCDSGGGKLMACCAELKCADCAVEQPWIRS